MTGAAGNLYNRAMLMKFLLAFIVFGIVAFLVGTMTAPQVGDGNPRVKILAAISAAKTHRAALTRACERSMLRDGITLVELDLKAPEAYAGNFRSRIDVAVASRSEATVTVALKSLGETVPDGATVTYAGTCTANSMTWARSTNPPDLLPPAGAIGKQ